VAATFLSKSNFSIRSLLICVDCISKEKISGWAKYQHKDNYAEIEVYVNGDLFETQKANMHRADLIMAKVSKDGNNGFIFDLKKNKIQDGSLVAVKVKNDVTNLKNGEQYV
jgi:hypothetical protein